MNILVILGAFERAKCVLSYKLKVYSDYIGPSVEFQAPKVAFGCYFIGRRREAPNHLNATKNSQKHLDIIYQNPFLYGLVHHFHIPEKLIFPPKVAC